MKMTRQSRLACLMILVMLCTMLPIAAMAGEETSSIATDSASTDLAMSPVADSSGNSVPEDVNASEPPATSPAGDPSASASGDVKGSESPPAATYTVTGDSAISGGSLSFSPASTSAGDTVTVTVSPDSGKQLVTDSLRYTADGGSTYTPITSSNGVYSFTMTAANVVVTAQFENTPVENMPEEKTQTENTPAMSYTVTADSTISGGSLSFSLASPAAGDTVAVTATPDSGKQLADGSLEYSADGGSTYTAITASNGIYSFTMPAANVIVTAQFESIPVTGTLSTVYLNGASGVDTNDGTTAAKAVKTFAEAKQLLAKNGTVYVTGLITLTDTQSWSLPSDTYGSAKVVRDSGYSGDLIHINSGGNLTLGNITLDGNNVAVYSSMITVFGGSLTLSEGSLLTNHNYSSGICINNQYGNVTLAGGKIKNNTVYEVIYLSSRSSVPGNLTINSGEISSNSTTYSILLSSGSSNCNIVLNTTASTIIESPLRLKKSYYMTVSGSLANVNGQLTLASSAPANGVVMAKGSSYTLTKSDLAKLSYSAAETGETQYYCALDTANNQIYLTEVISPTPKTLDFGSVMSTIATGYTVPTPQTVTITNSYNEPITLNQPADSNDFVMGSLSKTELDPNDTATFTVTPKGNLAVGSYRNTITLTSTVGQIANVAANFTVAPFTYSVTTTAGPGGTVTYNGASGTVNVPEETNAVFTINPCTGFSIADVKVDGISVVSGDSNYVFDSSTGTATYTFTAVKAGHTIAATFNAGTPTGSLAAVYLDGTNGADSNDGTSASAAVQTFARAKSLLAKDGIIYITGEVDVTGTEYWTLENYGKAMVKRGSGYTGDMICADYTADPSNLVLDNITIDGGYRDGIQAQGSIILVYGNLTMEDGAVLQNNYVSVDPFYCYGGAVSVQYSTFTMNGGVIQNNYTTCYGGGGVSVASDSTFMLNGGEIKNNTATAYFGGGVYNGGTFTMNGGTIGNNTAVNATYGQGGGIYSTASGTFTMNGGSISQNSAIDGGGLYNGNISNTVYSGNAIINGGIISNNSAAANGGGVYQIEASSGGSLTVNGGTITGNTAGSNGNGIYTEGSKITLSPASSRTFAIADSIYLASNAYLNLGATLANNPNSLYVKTALPVAGTVVAKGTGGYTATAADAAKFVYSTYEWDAALNTNNQIALVKLSANNAFSVDKSSLTFDLVAEGYSGSDLTPQIITLTNTGIDTITLNQPLGGGYFTVGELSKTTLASGETATFTVTPKTGLAAGSYNDTVFISTTNNDKTLVNVAFSVGYSITINQSEGGTITVTPNQTLFKKEDAYNIVFTFTPNPGYKLVQAIINGNVKNLQETENVWGISYPQISGNITCSAVFAPATYTINASIYNDEGGSISPSGSTAVAYLQNQAYTFLPDPGYHVSSVYVDNVGVDPSTYASNTYTFNQVTANHTLTAVFDTNQCTLVFNKNAQDATGTMKDQSFAWGDEGTLSQNAFSRSGYAFAGWATTAGGAKVYDNETPISNIAAGNNGTISLYAIWTSTTFNTGDINGDGVVNNVDVVKAVNFALEISTPTAEQFKCADMNGDGIINNVDVVKIVNKALQS